MTGKIKFYNSAKGFGFIKGDDDVEYFFHRSQTPEGSSLDEGVEVEFKPTEGDRGPKAEEITIK